MMKPVLGIRFVQGRDGAIVLDLCNDRFFSLNPTATLIWDRLAEGKMAEEIATELSIANSVGFDTALGDTRALISDLETNGLIDLPSMKATLIERPI